MSVTDKLIFAAFVALALTSKVGGGQQPLEFGKLRATLNGREFAGIFGRDSVLAIWDTTAGQLQIEGDKRGGHHRSEVVRLIMRCTALPRAGTYAIGNPSSPVSAYADLAPTLWQRIWPLSGARYRPFVSDSMPRGTLVLDVVDSANGIIKGHFNAALRSFNRTPAETLFVRGAFFGRVDLRQHFLRPKAKWAPGIQTDCERIRDAVAM